MSVLVTGGTGFVGGAVVKALLERGQAVRVLARRRSKTQHLTALGVEIAYGDILDQASIEAALAGCEILYHVAALYELWVPDKQNMLRIAVVGTRNALEAARRAGVRRVVYTSSVVTIGEPRGTVGTETTAHCGHFRVFYEYAKYQAEQVALTYAHQGLPVVIVNPAGVYGPGDLKPTGRGLVNLVNGRVPMIIRGAPFGVVYIDDVGLGHVLAAERGRVGERYILCERNVTMAEWAGVICRIAGTKVPPVGPEFLLWAAVSLGELVSRLTRRPPSLSKDNFTLLSRGVAVSGTRAREELGLNYTPFEVGMQRTIAWYWEQGLLKQKPAFLVEKR